MNKQRWWRQIQASWYCTIFFCLILFPASSTGADSTSMTNYEFDTTDLVVKPFDISASIEIFPSLLLYDKTTSFQSLQFGNDKRYYADNYNSKAELHLQLKRKQIIASLSGELYSTYFHRDDSLYFNYKFNEGYLKYTPHSSLSFSIGKQLFQWGKGYVFNPVSYAGRIKNPNDIDATLEGYYNLSGEYIKSFDSQISSVALTAAILPVLGDVNKGYLPDSSIAVIAQCSMLAANTDIDLCFYADNNRGLKTGIDFSRNIFPDWEIHSEWSYLKNNETMKFVNDSAIVMQVLSKNSFLAGTRYLAPFSTTFIFEYLHNGPGHTQKDMELYYQVMENLSVTNDPQYVRPFREATAKYYSAQFLATDYLFFKATHPDPFNFVYFTPSVYTIVNILDHSGMIGTQMDYSRSRHLLFTGRYIFLVGKAHSEYGVKLAQQRFELRAKWSF